MPCSAGLPLVLDQERVLVDQTPPDADNRFANAPWHVTTLSYFKKVVTQWQQCDMKWASSGRLCKQDFLITWSQLGIAPLLKTAERDCHMPSRSNCEAATPISTHLSFNFNCWNTWLSKFFTEAQESRDSIKKSDFYQQLCVDLSQNWNMLHFLQKTHSQLFSLVQQIEVLDSR